MCLAVPMEIIEIRGNSAVAELGGVRREVNVQLMEDARVGDYLIVHAGFAIQKLDREEAEKTLSLLRELADSLRLNPPRSRGEE